MVVEEMTVEGTIETVETDFNMGDMMVVDMTTSSEVIIEQQTIDLTNDDDDEGDTFTMETGIYN